MTRRKNSNIGCFFIVIGLIALGVIARVFEKLIANPGFVLIILIFAITFCYLWFRYGQMKKEGEQAESIKAREERFAFLMKKYNDKETVQKIMNSEIWQGMNAEQVTDTLGKPTAIDQELMKTKRRETWKYYPRGQNRYDLKLVLENDVLVGWEKKGQ